ncbi:MAG: TonB-dependent receptor domain-containing protein [Bryobacteraceae bacterium]
MCRFFLSLLFLSGIAFAQTDASSLSGAIQDPSGATIEGVRVTLRNRATGAQREAVTSADGRYQFNLAAPGLYEVTAQLNGFKSYRDSQVRLQVAQAAQLDIRMELGSTAESIDVEGTVSMLNTESASAGTVISEEKILALPLNGRQFVQLALLVPGANGGGRTVQQNQVRLGQIGSFSASGGRTNNNAFLLDGAANTDPDYNGLTYSPIVDSISEFQVQTSQFSAQYGRASGAQVNAVTKSGTNEWHGSAWEFLRNRVMDSRPFNLTESRLPKYQRNQFGGTLGGPVVKNRLFAFGAYEGLRIRQAGAGLTTVAVPTAAQRQGDFSGTPGGIYDPKTLANGVRQRFPGDRIPASRLNPLTLAALNALPPANVPGVSSFVNASGVLVQNQNNYSLRLDYVPSNSVTVFGRYSATDENNIIPDVVPDRERRGFVRPQNAVVGSTQVFGANKVNEIRAGFTRLRFQDGLPEPMFNVGGQQQALPRFVVAGYPTMGGAGGFTGTTGGGLVLARNNGFQIYDNFSWQRGAHSIKFGGDLMRQQYNRIESANLLGQYQFSAGFTTRTASNDGTGHILASYLLGLPQQGNRSVGPSRIDARQPSMGLYFQDDIRVRSNLTLNLGLRYELAPPFYDHREQMGSIDYRNVPAPQDIFAEGRLAFYKPTFFICGQSGTPRGCAYTDRNNFSPRVGIVWSPQQKTVVRLGSGIFYAAWDANPLFRLAAGLPNNIIQTLASNNFIPQFSNFDIFGPAVVGPRAVQQAGIDIDQRTSYSAQWSASVQREVRRDMVIEAGYLATMGIKLQQNVQVNNAQPGAGAVDPRRPYGGMVFAQGTRFPDYVMVAGDSVPVTFINYLPNSAQSNYHAFYLRFEKRFTQGLSWLSSYTFSKAITNAPQFRNAGGANGAENSPPQDSFNLRAERGLASFDARNRWVNTFVLDLPFGKGRRHLSSGVLSHILGGWQTSGILTMQSGFPFTVNLAGDTAGIGGGTGAILIRPNYVAGQTVQLPSSERTTARYFNTAAFAIPPAGTFGNMGRNTVIGPGMINMDLTLAKNIRLSERAGLQVRGEFFNLSNTPNYNIVGRIITAPTYGRVLNQLDPRQVQLAAKITF